jgi:hypothetical protein
MSRESTNLATCPQFMGQDASLLDNSKPQRMMDPLPQSMERAMRNFLIAKLCLAVILTTFASQPAFAQSVNIDIHIGTSLNHGRSISCSQGERLLRLRGFRDIRRIDCRGRFYVYRGSLGIRRFEVALNARDGRVVDKRRIRR